MLMCDGSYGVQIVLREKVIINSTSWRSLSPQDSAQGGMTRQWLRFDLRRAKAMRFVWFFCRFWFCVCFAFSSCCNPLHCVLILPTGETSWWVLFFSWYQVVVLLQTGVISIENQKSCHASPCFCNDSVSKVVVALLLVLCVFQDVFNKIALL